MDEGCLPCSSMPCSTASSSSDSVGYWNVLRRRVAAILGVKGCIVCRRIKVSGFLIRNTTRSTDSKCGFLDRQQLFVKDG